MEKINPEILRWARETAGFTLEEASQKLKIQVIKEMSPKERLTSLETGKIEPSRSMLNKMASLYRRPLLVFYMEKPPRKANRGQDFRTLSSDYSDATIGLVDALIRDIKTRQSILRSALEDEDDIKQLSFVGSMKTDDGIEKLVKSIIKTINFSLDKFREQKSQDEAFKYVRNLIEYQGIYVLLIGDLGNHLSAINLDLFRGFSISDNLAPFIVINDKDSHAAWIFTLFHELTHIWLGHTGISGYDSEQKIEKFCNQVASEILLPNYDPFFNKFIKISEFEEQIDEISKFARSKNISSSMVAYKLLILGLINQTTWKKLSNEFRNLWLVNKAKERETNRAKSGGPSYYLIRRNRLGENLISQVHQLHRSGTLSTMKAGKVLGVNPKNIQNLYQPKIILK